MIKVLHVFKTYLPKSEIWAFRALKYMPDVEQFILADQYNDLNTFRHNFQILDEERGLYNHDYHHLKDWKGRLFSRKADVLSLHPVVAHNAIDLIHFHFANTVELVENEILDVQIPYCISFYGYDYAQTILSSNEQQRDFYGRVLSHSAAIFCEGSYSKNVISQNEVDPSKIHIVPLGLLPKESQVRERKDHTRLRLVQIASFTPKKGQLESVQACLDLVNEGYNIELTLVGNPRDPAYFDTVIASSQNSPFIKILDWIDFEEIDMFLNNFDYFIHPSKTAANGDREGGSPTILLKAMQNGLPIISTTHCDISYQLGPVQQILLANEGNLEDLKRKITLANSIKGREYKEMSKYVQSRVNTFFDQRELSNKMVEIYRSSIKK